MNDEQLQTRITLLMQDVGWGIEGSYDIDEDAVARILNEHDASLRSQNQALQERAENAEENERHAVAAFKEQERRAEKAEARLQLAEDALAMYQAGAVTHVSIESRPTQETDPGMSELEPTCPDCGWPATRNPWLGAGRCPNKDFHARPTQETDPG